MDTTIPEKRRQPAGDAGQREEPVCLDCGCSSSVHLIHMERRRQIHEEGFTRERDAKYTDESMAMVAACYAAPSGIFRMKHGDPDAELVDAELVSAWPDSWHREWDKRGKHSRIKQLVIAGALIAAEIDRLSCQEQTGKATEDDKY